MKKTIIQMPPNASATVIQRVLDTLRELGSMMGGEVIFSAPHPGIIQMQSSDVLPMEIVFTMGMVAGQALAKGTMIEKMA